MDRNRSILLDSVVFRVGLLAALRSRKLNGQTIGVMITASHNPPEDNGVKLVDPMVRSRSRLCAPFSSTLTRGDIGRDVGGNIVECYSGLKYETTHAMLQESWEAYGTTLANAPSEEKLFEVYDSIIKECHINPDTKANVIFARDTRSSGAHLVSILIEALTATDTAYTDYKLLTTPQLHYITRCLNTKGSPYEYGEPTEQGYYEKTASSLKLAMQGRQFSGSVTVDCANGVGGPKLRELIKYLPPPSEGGLEIKVVNDDVLKPERLNHQVSNLGKVVYYIIAEGSLYSAEPTSSKPTSGHPLLPMRLL